jgi:hypothetical protein
MAADDFRGWHEWNYLDGDLIYLEASGSKTQYRVLVEAFRGLYRPAQRCHTLRC